MTYITYTFAFGVGLIFGLWVNSTFDAMIETFFNQELSNE